MTYSTIDKVRARKKLNHAVENGKIAAKPCESAAKAAQEISSLVDEIVKISSEVPA